MFPPGRGKRGSGVWLSASPSRVPCRAAGSGLVAESTTAEQRRFPPANAGAARDRRVLHRDSGANRLISLRKARVADAIAIGAVHVAAWRSTYPGILPDTFLARMSVSRQAAFYDAAIRGGTGVTVATASGADVPAGSGPRVIGFTTAGRARHAEIAGRRLAEGERETLY